MANKSKSVVGSVLILVIAGIIIFFVSWIINIALAVIIGLCVIYLYEVIRDAYIHKRRKNRCKH